MELINSFKKYLVTIVPGIIYKSVPTAESYETKESRLYGDQYVEALIGTGTFDSIESGSIPVPILNQVGIYDEYTLELIEKDKYVIPEGLRNEVYRLYKNDIIENYIEQNDYYRMLAGLPNNDEDSIYISPVDLINFGYTKDSQEDYDNNELGKLTPLHLLPKNVLLAMESNGFLDTIYEDYSKNPEYDPEYIKHLGIRRIDPFISRMAGQYELLYVPRVEHASRFITDFKNYYEEARQYFLNQIYNYHYNSEYDYYEGFIGFFILNMAIQRTITALFKVVVQRDFYDIETCRIFLESYGVPFIQTFSFNQQLILVKKLNILLMNKCTTTVLYDLLDILDYDDYTIIKYLLVKQHKMTTDANGEKIPVFEYKEVIDEDGNVTRELDKDKMYDYYFMSADVKDKDVTLVDKYSANAYSYGSITKNDAYWIEDNELINKLRDSEMNFVETKYASISVTIKMYQMLFEHAYLQKMICDRGDETSMIFASIPLISPYPISMLEIEVLLICLLCKYYNTSPDLIGSPSKTLAVLGFNFDADFEAIKKDIESNKRLYSQELINFIMPIEFNSIEDINDMYGNVKKLSNILIEGMETTTSEEVYHAYKLLYNTLFITDVHNEVFKLHDGKIPNTYMEWLQENNYELFDLVDSADTRELLDKINYITTKCINWFSNTEYFSHLNPMDTTVINGIIRILRWFKSYTMDITSLDVIYVFDSKYYNMMKMMTRIWMHAKGNLKEMDLEYNDWITHMSEGLSYSEMKGKLSDFLFIISHTTAKDRTELLKDSMLSMKSNGTINEKISTDYSDIITECHENDSINDTMTHKDGLFRLI